MKVVSITEVRQEATKLVQHATRTGEPVLVCIRSKPAAYLIKAGEYEEMLDELKRLRHELFWQGVAEAWSEYERGDGRLYDDVEAAIEDLGLEKE